MMQLICRGSSFPLLGQTQQLHNHSWHSISDDMDGKFKIRFWYGRVITRCTHLRTYLRCKYNILVFDVNCDHFVCHKTVFKLIYLLLFVLVKELCISAYLYILSVIYLSNFKTLTLLSPSGCQHWNSLF